MRRRALDSRTAADVAADRLADIVDLVEQLFEQGISRPHARKILEHIASTATEANHAVGDSKAPWSSIRTRALTVFHRSGRPLPHALPLEIHVTHHDNRSTTQ